MKKTMKAIKKGEDTSICKDYPKASSNVNYIIDNGQRDADG